MTNEQQTAMLQQELRNYSAALYTVTVRARVARAAGNNQLADAAQADAEMFQKMIDGYEEEIRKVNASIVELLEKGE